MSAGTAHRLVWLTALLPSLLFLATLAPGNFSSTGSALNTLGRLAGVAGLAMLLMAAILSARIPGVDRPFGGLTRLWRTHHFLGAWSLILLLAHPLLLAFSAGTTSLSAARTMLFPPLSDLTSWSGWAALILMMLFLAPSFSFFGHPRFERWKKLHHLAGPAVALALIHGFWLSRGLPQWLNITVWSVFAMMAVGAVTWRFVFSRRIGRRDCRIRKVERVANNVVELTLSPEHGKFAHEAGNFVYLAPYDPGLEAGYGEEHPYTLSSSPLEPALRIAIKDLGDASRAIQSIREGARATIEGPYGRFFPNPHAVTDPELWIAGGIGITPFLARMRLLQQLGKPADACLIFCVQDEARELYGRELRSLASSLSGFRLNFHHFYREGPITREYIERVCPDMAQRLLHVCGPRPLKDLVVQHARAAGIPVSSIHSEEFELL